MSLMQTAPTDPTDRKDLMDRALAVALRKNRVSFVPTMWARQAARSAKKGAKKIGEQVVEGVADHFGKEGVKKKGGEAVRALFESPKRKPLDADGDTPFDRRVPIRTEETHEETMVRRQDRKKNKKTWAQEQLDKLVEGAGDGLGDGGGESKQQRLQLPKIG